MRWSVALIYWAKKRGKPVRRRAEKLESTPGGVPNYSNKTEIIKAMRPAKTMALHLLKLITSLAAGVMPGLKRHRDAKIDKKINIAKTNNKIMAGPTIILDIKRRLPHIHLLVEEGMLKPNFVKDSKTLLPKNEQS